MSAPIRISKSSAGPAVDFLAGGGDMGARMRALDWTRTPLGPPERWPQSLKTIVRVMLDSRYAMWMLWGPELTFFCNDAYLPTVGIKRDWVLGARSDKVWEEVWPDIGPRIAQVLEQGQATWDEALLLFLERSGFPEETYHTFSYSPVYDDANRIAGMLCVVTEVTDRVIGEQRLRILKELAERAVGWKSVEECCRGACEILDRHALSMPFAAIYLLDGESVPRRAACTRGRIEQLLPRALDAASARWPFARLLGGEVPAHITNLPTRGVEIAAGSWPDLVRDAVALPLKGAGGEGLAGFLLVGASPRRALDEPYRNFFALVAGQISAAIGDAQAAEAERRRAQALAEIDRAKTIFFSNVSHEFRTPLTLMLGPVEEAAANPAVPAPIRTQLELAHRNSVRLLKLVNSLLDFSRLEAGRMAASYEATDLAALTRNLASAFRSAMERAGLDFLVEVADLGEPVYVDREMWDKIVLNLLSNAFKFTLRGSVSVRLRRAERSALLEIEDTGVGIPRSELPHLFERFYRVEGSAGRTQEGSGIGLALVQELVKLHGGSVRVQSVLESGTLFAVEIPFGAAHLPAAQIKQPRALASTAVGAQAFVQEALRWMPEDLAATSRGLHVLDESQVVPGVDRRFADTAGARVLLADDNADMRAYLCELLSPSYVVESVGDGEAALAAMRATRPDLILSDIMMPRVDGLELLRRMRAEPQLREIPVILLSARAGEEARIEGLDAGADDYLIKPFAARELLARIGALLELTGMRRQSEARLRAFLAMLAHELRNPLAPLTNATELFARTLPADSGARAALGMIRRQVTQLTRLVDDLLDVSRITQGLVKLQRLPVNLADVVHQAVENVEPQLREKRHQLSTTTASYEPLYVNGDFARLVQCVDNLLTNAIKYTRPGGQISVRIHGERDRANIEVSDNGSGIAPELQPLVFELFVQSTRTLDRAEGGLGVGLAVVKRLIEMHEGQVRLYSAGIGHGSTFEIELPRIARPCATASTVSEVRAEPRRVLIVDDNVDAADSLAALLQAQGHATCVAYNGSEALVRTEAFRPDVSLIDIGLPGMNGYELAKRLRRRSGSGRQRLIALSGYAQPDDREYSQRAGFDAHLVKPVDLAVLEQALGEPA